ncbi:MAG: GtrA family protein [Rhodanobacteraceae bacterium]|jgi:putative flippase GtrA|nr:GtrA family protein [Rhodanobacteraceae bacterium]
MSLLRQGRHFILIGLLQWLVDWGVMVALSRLGMAVAGANLAGRVSGALLGFWLNGSITFAVPGRSPGWRQLGRYLVLWCLAAAASTGAVWAIDQGFGLHGAWLGKPLVDGTLALASFLASRHWVYR